MKSGVLDEGHSFVSCILVYLYLGFWVFCVVSVEPVRQFLNFSLIPFALNCRIIKLNFFLAGNVEVGFSC